MVRFVVAVLAMVGFLAGAAQARTEKLCSKGLEDGAILVTDDTADDDGVLNMVIKIGNQTTKFEYGGSMATGSGISQWFQVDKGEVALDDGDKIEWNGRTFKRCGQL